MTEAEGEYGITSPAGSGAASEETNPQEQSPPPEVQGPTAGGGATVSKPTVRPPAPLPRPVRANPQPYETVTAFQRQQRPPAVETTPLVPPTPAQSEHLLSLRTAFRAYLGLGRWYSGIWLFISFLLFAGGVIIIGIVLSLFAKDQSPGSPVNIAGNILCGIALVLVSSLRPLAGPCDRARDGRRKKLFAGLAVYVWLVSVWYAFAVGVMATSAPYCFSCKESNIVSRMSVWVLMAMVATPTAFFCGLALTYICVCTYQRHS